MSNYAARLSLMLAALAIGGGTTTSPAVATPPSLPIAVVEDCVDGVVLLAGDPTRVRQRVPADFELVRDPLGRPLLFAFVSRCARYTVAGTTRPTTSGYFTAIVESRDGVGCLSRWPILGALKPDLVPVCNLYFLSGAYDNAATVATYRSHFPELDLQHVPNLSFDLGGFSLAKLGTPLRFRSGPPMSSPLEVDGVVREQPISGPATFTFWSTGATGTRGGRLEIDALALGQMSARVRVAPGSEMAGLLGTATPTPLLGLVGRYGHAVLTSIEAVS